MIVAASTTLLADSRFRQEYVADEPLHQEAADVLRAWAYPLPADVEAKY